MQKRFFYGWAIVTGGFLFTFSYGVFYALTVFFDAIQKEFNWSSTLISSIHSLHLLTFIPAGIVMSWLVEKYNPRLMLGISSLVVGAGISLLSRVHSIEQFYLFYALATIGTGGMWAPPIAIAQRWFIQKRGLALGIITAGVGAGTLVHAPLANLLISSFGWRQAYIIEGGITFLLLAAGALLMVSSPAEKGLKPLGAEAGTSEAHVENQAATWTLGEAAKTLTLNAISLVYFFTVLPMHLLAVHFVPFAMEAGISKASAAAAWGVMGGVGILGRVGMGSLGQKMGWKQALAFCCGMCALISVWLVFTTKLWMLYVFALVYGFFFGGKVPQVMGLLGFCFGTRSLAPLIAYAHSLSLIGGAAGPILAGFIHDQTGNYYIAIWASVTSWVLAASITYFVVKPPLKLQHIKKHKTGQVA